MNGISDAEFIEGAYIQEGVSPAADVIIAACTIGDDYDNPKNRIGVRKPDGWLEFGLSAEAILSVDAADNGFAYVLGENGSVVRFDWKSSTTREELKASRKAYANPAVANIGPLRRIRIIGADVISGGSVGQVYRLFGDRFETLKKLIVGGRDVTIEDFTGNSLSDFVAVTSDGYAAHFDGANWNVLDLPTNASLTSICQLKNGHYAIAGKNGTVLIGVEDQWSIIQPIDTSRSYWGIATHNGNIYVAHLAGVDKVVSNTLHPLDIKDADDLQFTVLRSSSEGVWSFAGTTIGLIRENQWQTIMK